MAVTIKDIARETGLSTATISKCLNHYPIKEENRLLIEAAIEKLNYHPNQTARLLRAKRQDTICIVLSSLGDYFWGDLICAVTNYFTKHHYMVITHSYSFDPEEEANLIQDLILQNVSGVVLLPHSTNDAIYEKLIEANIPTVIIDYIFDREGMEHVDCVASDNYRGGQLLAQCLLRHGHKKVFCVETETNSYSSSIRLAGFTSVFEQAGIHPQIGKPLLEMQGEDRKYYAKSSIENAEELRSIMRSDDPPTAIFFANYTVAIGVLFSDVMSDIRIPEDISVVCFDDDILFQALRTPMTCVSQKLDEIGEEASRILLRRMRGDYEDFPCYKKVDVIYHERKSVRTIEEQ